MNKHFDELLCRRFPNLYRLRNDPHSCMARGFEFGDGWMLIAWNLSIILESLIVAMPESERTQYCMDQFKQKFGEIRISMLHRSTELMGLAISRAVLQSRVTCADCGMPGTMRQTKDGWMYVSCELDMKL